MDKIAAWISTKSSAGSDVQENNSATLPMAMSQATIPEDQVWKTYYYAGSQRVAMRVQDGSGGDEVYYLLSDHLGSTSVSYRASDGQTIPQYYYPWGAVRSGLDNALPSDYTFTGQRSEVDSFGLMYYNARWYDPFLGRFAQADSIVPEPGNPLAWDRYSYVFNNPLKFVDPNGYFCVNVGSNTICSQDDDYSKIYMMPMINAKLYQYGITTKGLTCSEKFIVLQSAEQTGQKLIEIIGETSSSTFKAVHGQIHIEVVVEEYATWEGNCQTTLGLIQCKYSPNLYNIIHEFGHVFDKRYQRLSTVDDYDADGYFINHFAFDYLDPQWVGSKEGYLNPDIYIQNDAALYMEEGADMYLYWILNTAPGYDFIGFSDDETGRAREDWMNKNMIIFLKRMGFK